MSSVATSRCKIGLGFEAADNWRYRFGIFKCPGLYVPYPVGVMLRVIAYTSCIHLARAGRAVVAHTGRRQPVLYRRATGFSTE
jgi:hypothetical protein